MPELTLQAQLDAANRRITELEAELEQAHYAAAFGPDEALDRLFKDGLDVYEGNPDDLGDVPTRKVFKVFDAGDRDVGIDPVTYFYVDVPPEDQNARLRTEVVMAAKDLVYVLNGRVSEEEWRGYVDGTLSLSGLAESVLSEVVRLRHEIARYEAEGRERDALAKGKYTLECRNGVVHGNRSRDICLHCRLAELERENAELRRDAKARTGDNVYVDAVLKERNELRRTVEEGSKEMKAVWDYLQRVSPWSESNDMDWADEIICGIGGLERRIAELEGNPPTLSLTPDGRIVDPRAAVTQREIDLEEALVDMVNQHCHCDGGDIDSMALSANAYAMRLLAERGRMEITNEYGRRVLAKWTENSRATTGGESPSAEFREGYEQGLWAGEEKAREAYKAVDEVMESEWQKLAHRLDAEAKRDAALEDTLYQVYELAASAQNLPHPNERRRIETAIVEAVDAVLTEGDRARIARYAGGLTEPTSRSVMLERGLWSLRGMASSHQLADKDAVGTVLRYLSNHDLNRIRRRVKEAQKP